LTVTHDEAFLQAIFQAPDDDAPRLVYADWLEEHGQPERAEFIRVQCALARPGQDLRREADRRRAQELWDQFGADWARPLTARGWKPEFRRGFPELAWPGLGLRRRGRVQITYDVETAGGMRRIELPFVIGVLADLSGHRREGVLPLGERKIPPIDRDNFDRVMAKIRPELHLEVPRRPAGEGGPLRLDLSFERLEDFGPVRLVERIPELRRQLDIHRRRAEEGAGPDELAALDRRLSSQLAAVLHHPDFQRLEATWRGLHYLVHKCDDEAGPKIRVLNAAKRELLIDMERAVEFDQSTLFRKVYEEEYGGWGGEPYGMLVADYEFSRTLDDVNTLKLMSMVASAAHAPLVANASAKMFNVERFTELTAPRDLAKIFWGKEYNPWRSFRDSEDSRYVALTMPRVLGRLPYGEEFKKVDEFNFEEFVDGRDHDKYLWMGAAWAYAANIADAYCMYGWMARTRGAEGGGKVTGLPALPFGSDDGDVAAKCPCEIAISDRREFELSNLGFLPLIHSKNNGFAAFMGAQPCQKPKTYLSGDAYARAAQSAKFNYLLCASRFAHYLKFLSRDRLSSGGLMEVDEFARWLSRWIGQYTVAEPPGPSGGALADYYLKVMARDDPHTPLAEARVEVRAVRGKPGWFEVVAWLRPSFQFTEPTWLLRLVAEIPRRAS
jgi:type VI secretion system protein ImpC